MVVPLPLVTLERNPIAVTKLAPERALGVGAVSLSWIHSESAFGPSLSSRLPSVSLRVAGGLGEGRMKRESIHVESWRG